MHHKLTDTLTTACATWVSQAAADLQQSDAAGLQALYDCLLEAKGAEVQVVLKLRSGVIELQAVAGDLNMVLHRQQTELLRPKTSSAQSESGDTCEQAA
jgi:hypothetical protein